MKGGDSEKAYSERKSVEDEENSPIPVVAAAVSTKDDPKLPCITFRFWILSTFFTSLGATLSEFYYFRPNGGGFSMFFVLLVSYVLGKWMAKVLPTKKYKIKGWEFSLNPGPFNVKEHVCIAISTGAGGGSAYATDIIAIQELFYHTSVNFIKGFLLLMSTQIIGYGLSGFLRKYLVRPANMIWPTNLVFASMYNTLHGDASETRDKLRFFLIAFSMMFVWQFVPQYMFTWLTSMALLCLIAPYNSKIKKLGSGYHGYQDSTFFIDIGSAKLTRNFYPQKLGKRKDFHFWQLILWIKMEIGEEQILPVNIMKNILAHSSLTHTYFFEIRYNQTLIIDRTTGSLNVTAYEGYSPVYLSITFAMSYLYSFIALTAAISHVFLFYGKDIWKRFRASREEEKEDIHCRLMKAYPEIPNTWYALIFVGMLAIAITLGYITEANLPWWGLLIAVALAAIMVLPIGVIQAISNNQVGLNVVTEMICGYILPGRPIANVYFKCYGYMAMYQCLLLVSDLKLGHYMKIPPRCMFTAQLWGTIVGGFVNFWILKLIIAAKRPFLDGTLNDPTGQVGDR
ncbi:11182_t:CDS:10 [Acaulospora colombiana]|uniref:11182_t:CDS:1 n=1 Tax=Acaulospora colombiana TaxID=27376 RepID=A0ACA9K1K8_9GLOM|nr:11182_t:CDS:10 [Acaulospora colombiana]